MRKMTTKIRTLRSGSLPYSLKDFIERMQSELMLLPEDSRETAGIDLCTEYEYGDEYPVLNLTYQTFETEEEAETRERREKIDREQTELREKKLLETLQRKYGK